MPKKQIGRKIDVEGNIDDLGYTVTKDEIDNWNGKVSPDVLQDYVTKTGYSMRASSTAGKFYYNTGAGEKSIQVKMPTVPTTTSQLTNDSGFVTSDDIPDTSGFAKTSDLANYVKNNANQTIKGNSSDTPLILESATTSSYIGFKRTGDTAVWGYLGVNASRKPTFYATKDEELALKSDLGTQATFSLSGTTLTITPK